MKKIMFNDRFGLTKAVLDGTKTMTRRVIPELLNVEDPDISEWGLTDGGKAMITLYEGGRPTTDIFPMYQPGEVVAVAQSYKDAGIDPHFLMFQPIKGSTYFAEMEIEAMFTGGWNNKMFVRADLMPHQIRITDIKVERLQNISDDDVYREGFSKNFINNGWGNAAFHEESVLVYYDKLGLTKTIRSIYPKDAFAVLIDKVSGKGTWESNPWVFAYSFELIK